MEWSQILERQILILGITEHNKVDKIDCLLDPGDISSLNKIYDTTQLFLMHCH